jgi:hypothetical protein
MWEPDDRLERAPHPGRTTASTTTTHCVHVLIHPVTLEYLWR